MRRLTSCLGFLVAALFGACKSYSEDPVVPVPVVPVDAGTPDATIAPISDSGGVAAPDAAPTPEPDARAWRYVFVTSSARNGAFGGREGGDRACAEAAAAGLPALHGRKWLAWLSATNLSARDRITTGDGRIKNEYRLVTDEVAFGASVTFSPDEAAVPARPIRRDEHGVDVGSVLVWTGSGSYGEASDATCAEWDDRNQRRSGRRRTHRRSGRVDDVRRRSAVRRPRPPLLLRSPLTTPARPAASRRRRRRLGGRRHTWWERRWLERYAIPPRGRGWDPPR